jgi:branched-chain amino acid transport system ATP-binding protein
MALLEVEGLLAGYKGVTVVRGIDLHVEPGEVVALLGANGAGKSTTLLTISGLAEQQAGTVRLAGTDLGGMHAAARAKAGLGHVTEDRSLFTKLTTMENLRLGGRGELDRLDEILELLPALIPLLNRQSGSLSGGEQQMLALARALMPRPQVLMVDELSLGLAPLIVRRLLENLRQLADDGLAVLMVEQHVEQALRIADRVIVLARGRVSFAGAASELAGQRDRLAAAYLGGSPTTADMAEGEHPA